MSRTRWWQVGLLVALGGILLALPVSFFNRATREHVLGAAFSADGSLLARSSLSGTAVFDVRSGKRNGELPVNHAHVVFSPDMRLLVSGDLTALTVWDWPQGKALFSWPGTNRWAFRVAVSPDGSKVAGADDQSLRVWDLSSGALLTTIPLGYEHDSLTFSPDSKLVIIAGSDSKKRIHEVRLWTVPEGKLHTTLVGPEHCIVKSVAVSPDGKLLATGLSTAAVRLWDLPGRSERWKATDVGVDYEALCFTSDGKSFVVGGWGAATVFGVTGPDTRKSFGLPQGGVEAVWAGPQPGQFQIAVEGAVHTIDVASGRVELVREGFGIRLGIPFRAVALTAALWAVLWTVVYCRGRPVLPTEAVAGERWAWAGVLVTAGCSVGHWGLLVGLASGGWGGTNPLSVFKTLAVLWLVFLCVVALFALAYRRHRFFLLTSAFCLVAAATQMIFDLYLFWAVAASV